MVAETKNTVKAHCPTCDGTRTCDVHGTVYKSWVWEDEVHGHTMNGGDDYSLLECRGCETVFYERQSWNSEDVDPYYDRNGETQFRFPKSVSTYPAPDTKTKPVWFDVLKSVDRSLHDILDQAYTARENGARILTAIGLRTALDRATEVLGINPGHSFERKLDELRVGGWIGDTERDVLGVVTDAGNAAAHRGWQPGRDEIDQLVASMEVFLHRAFIVGKDALQIKESIPPRPERVRSKRETGQFTEAAEIPVASASADTD